MTPYGSATLAQALPMFSMTLYNRMTEVFRQRYLHGGSSVEFLTDRLGRADQSWVGGSERRRFQIWYRPPFYVLANNDAGISLEVSRMEHPSEAKKAFDKLMEELSSPSE